MNEGIKNKLIVVGVFLSLLVLLYLVTYADQQINPETVVYKNITVGERFPSGPLRTGAVVSTDNEAFIVVDRDVWWKLVPGRTYNVTLSYNWSPMNRMDNSCTLTDAVEIQKV